MTLVAGMLLFTFQIYGDFSGYSDIAIGTARLFGIRLMENFRLPYFSATMPEFWRRWHISLMTWFRDYLYIPLGGSREGNVRTIRNILIVFLLSGLWHGANWTFVVWGLYNACLLLLWRVVRLRSILLTFLLAAVGWVVFRSASMTEAVDYFSTLVSQLSTLHLGSIAHGKQALLWCLLLVVIEWLQRRKDHPLQLDVLPVWVRWTAYYALILLTVFARGEEQTFIYFQF
jgi:D-alanyl-lipoteichoic acid acyltransferase DltB (MBOAT superfamily)